MYSLKIHNPVPAELAGIIRVLGSEATARMPAVVGRAGQQTTRDHLYELATLRHRPGVSPNFYQQAADSVTHAVEPDGAEIRIDHTGVAQRYYGGRINAVNYTHLWIPVHPRSIGRSAGEFPGLVPIISPLTNKGVAFQTGRRDQILFALVPHVDQRADPSVLPTDDDYRHSALAAIDDLVETLLDRQSATP